MMLVVLAAGMSSRFGKSKQTEPVDEYGNFIIDYSLFDASISGFDRATVIIRKENESLFRETLGKRLENRMDVTYVFQEMDTIPDSRIPSDRTKPLGTAHAILCCKDVVDQPFAIINADDFYGPQSFRLASEFIKTECSDRTYGCVCYKAGKTISENGSVKRGVCTVVGGNVVEITESVITQDTDGKLLATPLSGGDAAAIDSNTPVSMNMFILPESSMTYFEKGFQEFLSTWDDPMTSEYLLPEVVSNIVNDGNAELKCIKTDEKWFGMTYIEDLDSVKTAISGRIRNGDYPDNMYSQNNEAIPISICICAYNEENNIERTIRSAFSQNGDAFTIDKVIAVSSGSTDNTDSIILKLTEEYEKLMFLPQKKREGKNSAINLALDNTDTEVVVLLNADNIFENNNSLNELIKPFRDKNIGMTGGHPVPTNDMKSFTGFTVHLLWSMHHHVSMIHPKIGELVAFRDIGTRLPTDMQSDEDIIRMKLEEAGYGTVYAPEAKILNRGPENVKDYIKQRTRVNIGENIIKKEFKYDLPTHNYRILVNAMFSAIKDLGFHPIKLVFGVSLEMYTRLKAKIHVAKNKQDDNVWEQVTSTKKV